MSKTQLTQKEVDIIRDAVGRPPEDQNLYHNYVAELHAIGNAMLLLQNHGFKVTRENK